MPQVYSAPIGPTQSGAPLPSSSLAGQVMLAGTPIPSITGGAAGPSAAGDSTSGAVRNYIYSNSGNTGSWLFISIAAIAGLLIWKKMKK